jgi:cell division protease FtsH
LETHKTLTGDDVVAVLEGRPGPLIDGSAYRRPEFLKAIEDYHKAATSAHEGHARVLVSLPSAPDVEPKAAMAPAPIGAASAVEPEGAGEARS